MNGFRFPDDDLERFKRDCEQLRLLLVGDVELHCAMLRGLGIAAGGAALANDELNAVVLFGVLGAAKRRLISAEKLRQLAQDADTLQMLADRVFEEGDPAVWVPETETLSVKDCERGFLAAVREYLGQPLKIPAPALQDDELHETFTGYLSRGALEINAIIVEPMKLRLRAGGKLWGILCVDRMNPSRIRVRSRTGTFLAWEIPPALTTGLAAKDTSEQTASACELFGTRDGFLLRIRA